MDFTAEIGIKKGIPEGSLTSMVSFVGLGRLDTQDCAGLGFSSESTFPLIEERRRAVDRLLERRGRKHWIVRNGRSVRSKSLRSSRMVSET